MSRFMILRSGRYAYPDGGGELPDAGLRYHPRMSGADSGDTDAARCSMPRAAAQPPLGVGNNVSGGFRLRRSARLESCAQRALLDRITTLGMIYASGEPTSTPVATLIYRTNHAKRRAELDEPCCSVRLMARHKAIRRRAIPPTREPTNAGRLAYDEEDGHARSVAHLSIPGAILAGRSGAETRWFD